MPRRTSLILDDECFLATRELAMKLDCSNAEAIRRAILRYRNIVLGVPSDIRSRRRLLIEQLIELSDGEDPEAEVVGPSSPPRKRSR